ncbi:acyltransferase family protein [Treponema sp. SP13]|uniref:acyltransferase family protein n=1 Tax=Treponema sp. SP13 TaxID=2789742 RepID=UPI003D8EBA8E
MDGDVSCRITSLRFLLIVFVVFIHNCYTSESIQKIIDAGGTPPVFVENAFGHWVKLFITFGLARCAVPLLFMFSAFLQAKKDDSYPLVLKKKAKSLLLPYVLWMALLAFFYGGFKLIIAKIAPQLLSQPDNTCLKWTFVDWIHKTLGYKPKPDGGFELPEFAVQFWFVRDLLILTIVLPVIKTLIKKFPVGFLAFLLTVYIVSIRVYFVETTALFFYVAGLYWGMYDIPLFVKIDEIEWKEIIPLVLFSFVTAFTFGGGEHSIFHNIMVIFDCVIFIKLSAIIVRKEKLYEFCSYLAGFSFFLFAIHAPLINGYTSKLWIRFFPMKNTFWSLCQYFIPTFITIIIGTGIGIVLKKLFPPIFRVLNGGR